MLLARKKFAYDLTVLEIGTDGPNQLNKFSYLQPDLTILTSIAAEHMEYFDNLDQVAKEELTALAYSKIKLLNIDDIPIQYLPNTDFLSYGFNENADYRIVSNKQLNLSGQKIELNIKDKTLVINSLLLGRQGAKITAAALAAGDIFGCPIDQLHQNLSVFKSFSGRLNVIPAINDSLIIDDSYNASPTAVIAALEVLYDCQASQRIAVLGDMNELGHFSQDEHIKVGNYCRPNKLDLVITIGDQAASYLAPAAKQNGCNVISFDSPYKAGNYLKDVLKKEAVILVKGSQNGVFSEEAIKFILKNPKDRAKLVRQSKSWLKIKKRQFKDYNLL